MIVLVGHNIGFDVFAGVNAALVSKLSHFANIGAFAVRTGRLVHSRVSVLVRCFAFERKETISLGTSPVQDKLA